ncbi:MAG: alkaline phosphatase family protein [Anaeromyxobacter sp.]
MPARRRSSQGQRARRAERLADAAGLAMRALLRPIAGQGRFRPGPLPGGARRLLLIQLDGVSLGRLREVLAAGRLPALAARLARGSHALSGCRSGLPSSTPAYQAGLLYGRSPAVPGFIWCDRRTGREVRMDRAADAAALERSLGSGGRGLLRGGTSYFSIFSGDAAVPHFCLSGLSGELDLGWFERELGPWDAAASALVHTVTAGRAAVRLAHEAGLGLVDGLRWVARVRRLRHEPRFLLHRVFISSVLRELAIQGILLDVSRGLPVVYADFLGFDEAAHRRGPASAAALRRLEAADAALATIFAAVEAAPGLGYDVFVLSDHGHVPTTPFEALSGLALPAFVGRAERGEPLPRGPAPLRPNRGLLGGRTLGGARTEGIAVAEAGALAHVYFLREGPGPHPLDVLRARHGRVLAALAGSPAVGLVAARGGQRGVVLVGGGALALSDPADVARLPHPEPRLLATYLSDLLSLESAGDLVVLGWRGPCHRSVAYAWEFGSHGGAAPEELDAFVLHPAACPFRFDQVLRPAELNAFFEQAYRGPAEEAQRERARRAPPSPEAAAEGLP